MIEIAVVIEAGAVLTLFLDVGQLWSQDRDEIRSVTKVRVLLF